MKRINEQNDFLRVLYDVTGMDNAKPNAADRRIAAKWVDEWGFDMSFIAQCAAWAVGKDRPLGYLDRMLESYHAQGITTIEAAQKAREQFQQTQAAKAAVLPNPTPVRGPKVVGEQQYTQRDYTHTDNAIDDMMKKWQEENGNA